MGNQQRQRLLSGKLTMSLVHPVNTSWCLEKICESNYRKLLLLIPELHSFHTHAIGMTAKNPDLHLEVIDRSKHTMTIELSHCFNHNLEDFIEPAVKIRIYFDAQQAEVLRDHARHDVFKVYKYPSQSIEIRDYKWKLNYFLQKWLDHCLKMQYHFSESETKLAIA